MDKKGMNNVVLKQDLKELFSNNYKLIALDVDGTLINSNHILTNRTIRALRAVKDLGIDITIATGRHYLSAIRLAQNIPISAPLISSDGAVISDIYTNETIYNLLPQDIAVDIVKEASKYKNFRIEVFIEDGRISSAKSYRSIFLRRFLKAPFKYSLKGYYNLLRDFVLIPTKNTADIKACISVLEESPAKVVVHGNEKREDLRAFVDEIITKYNNKISITSAIDNCVDVLKGGISKAKGLEILSKKLGIKPEEIITVGDNINDIEMLEYAGLGVAMGNASSEVKERADYVTASNNENGLAKFLELLVLYR
ncbi:MAG: Cof-type HAD-IIB family hydrolase [Tepidanaerobacteraceae bacterium]